MTRICITGGPRTEKTTLAIGIAMRTHDTGCPMTPVPHEGDCTCSPHTLRHTDDLIGKLEWSDASAEAARWLDEPGPWVIEGVAVSRALRKWHDQHPDQPPPVDRVIYLENPHEDLSKGQAAMAKGVRKVHDEVEAWLNEHGITTEYR